MKTRILIIAIVAFCRYAATAQNDTMIKNKDMAIWANAGLMLAADENVNSMFGGNLGINACINHKHYFFLRVYDVIGGSIGINLNEPIKENMITETGSFNFMYGISKYTSKPFSFVCSAGLSYSQVDWKGEFIGYKSNLFWGNTPNYKYYKFKCWGVPLAISFMWKTTHYAFSIDLYANIHKHPDFGIVLNNHLGKI
jgi:hypothetical protein